MPSISTSTNPALDLASFDQNAVTLLPPAGAVSSSLTSLTVTVVPEPSSSALAIAGLLALLGMASETTCAPASPGDRRQSLRSHSQVSQ